MIAPSGVRVPPNTPLPNRVVLERLYQIERMVKETRYEDAARAIDRLLAKHPTDPHANFRAGWLCALRGHYEVALDFLRRALKAARCPWSEALNAIGAVLMRMGRYDEGLPYLQAAAVAAPQNPEVWINLANWAEGSGRDDLALDILARASRHPGNLGAPGIRWARSFIELKRGDYLNGWRDYECRWLNTEWLAARARTFVPGSEFWYGGPIPAGDTLLVHFEQGMGDTVQCLRYLPWVRARTSARLLLQVQKPLVPLVQRRPDLYDALSSHEGEPTGYQWHVSMMSLPHAHDTRLDTIPPPLRLAAGKAA